MNGKKLFTLQQFVSYLKDAGTRYQVDVERAAVEHPTMFRPTGTFSEFWRSFYHYVRSDHPKTLSEADGIRVAQAINDVETFKENLPTRPKGKKP